MVATVLKNTNATLIVIVFHAIIFMLSKHTIGDFSRFFLRTIWGQKSLGSLEPLEIADLVFYPHNKITTPPHDKNQRCVIS
jgi:hypothetical protein